MIVVSDTTAISSLHKISHLHILKSIFGEVIIPSQVLEELSYFEIDGLDFLATYPWIKVEVVRDVKLIATLAETLDEGESSAIALTIQLQADLLLIDEKLGRKIAAEKGIAIVGLIGVLEIAKKHNHIALVKPVLDDLITVANFRISRPLYERTLEAANEK